MGPQLFLINSLLNNLKHHSYRSRVSILYVSRLDSLIIIRNHFLTCYRRRHQQFEAAILYINQFMNKYIKFHSLKQTLFKVQFILFIFTSKLLFIITSDNIFLLYSILLSEDGKPFLFNSNSLKDYL